MSLQTQCGTRSVHHVTASVRNLQFDADKHGSPRKLLRNGEHLFHAGERLVHAYVVRSGTLKSYVIHEDGEEQFLEIHGPGDVLGFDAALGEPARRSVVALDICSLEPLLHVAGTIDDAEAEAGESVRTLLEGMYREIGRLTRRLELERHHSERRMAGFLLDLIERQGRGNDAKPEITLPVTRRNLAQYLGMAPETVSRTLCGFQCRELIKVNNRAIRIVDLDALESMA